MSAPPRSEDSQDSAAVPAPAAHFRERLSVPVWWWLVGAAIAATFVVAVWAILNWSAALAATLVFGGVMAWGFLSWSRSRVEVTDRVWVDGAQLSPEWIASVEVLNVASFRSAVAGAATAGDYLVIRPWLASGVRIILSDPADPHPSWIVACRHSGDFAAAIERLKN